MFNEFKPSEMRKFETEKKFNPNDRIKSCQETVTIGDSLGEAKVMISAKRQAFLNAALVDIKRQLKEKGYQNLDREGNSYFIKGTVIIPSHEIKDDKELELILKDINESQNNFIMKRATAATKNTFNYVLKVDMSDVA